MKTGQTGVTVTEGMVMSAEKALRPWREGGGILKFRFPGEYEIAIQTAIEAALSARPAEIAAWPWAFPSLACENCSEPVSVDFRYCPNCKATDKRG